METAAVAATVPSTSSPRHVTLPKPSLFARPLGYPAEIIPFHSTARAVRQQQQNSNHCRLYSTIYNPTLLLIVAITNINSPNAEKYSRLINQTKEK